MPVVSISDSSSAFGILALHVLLLEQFTSVQAYSCHRSSYLQGLWVIMESGSPLPLLKVKNLHYARSSKISVTPLFCIWDYCKASCSSELCCLFSCNSFLQRCVGFHHVWWICLIWDSFPFYSGVWSSLLIWARSTCYYDLCLLVSVLLPYCLMSSWYRDLV